jgi:hypothetical protein
LLWSPPTQARAPSLAPCTARLGRALLQRTVPRRPFLPCAADRALLWRTVPRRPFSPAPPTAPRRPFFPAPPTAPRPSRRRPPTTPQVRGPHARSCPIRPQPPLLADIAAPRCCAAIHPPWLSSRLPLPLLLPRLPSPLLLLLGPRCRPWRVRRCRWSTPCRFSRTRGQNRPYVVCASPVSPALGRSRGQDRALPMGPSPP